MTVYKQSSFWTSIHNAESIREKVAIIFWDLKPVSTHTIRISWLNSLVEAIRSRIITSKSAFTTTMLMEGIQCLNP